MVVYASSMPPLLSTGRLKTSEVQPPCRIPKPHVTQRWMACAQALAQVLGPVAKALGRDAPRLLLAWSIKVSGSVSEQYAAPKRVST